MIDRDRAAAIGRLETGPDLKAAAKRIADRYITPGGLTKADARRQRVEDLEERALAGLYTKPTDRKQDFAYQAIKALARMARGEE
jgi:hypothetical protein